MLPYWLLVKKAGHPAGMRLPKWKKYEPPPPPPVSMQRYLPSIYKPKLSVSSINGDIYRFWKVETYPEGETYTCRRCKGISLSHADRIAHLKGYGCAKTLISAYKLLLRDMRCVICDIRTDNMKWGVPICTGACERQWCEEEARPLALVNALRLADPTFNTERVFVQ